MSIISILYPIVAYGDDFYHVKHLWLFGKCFLIYIYASINSVEIKKNETTTGLLLYRSGLATKVCVPARNIKEMFQIWEPNGNSHLKKIALSIYFYIHM